MKDAHYYREYRARKKAQKKMTMANSSLFAKVSNDEKRTENRSLLEQSEKDLQSKEVAQSVAATKNFAEVAQPKVDEVAQPKVEEIAKPVAATKNFAEVAQPVAQPCDTMEDGELSEQELCEIESEVATTMADIINFPGKEKAKACIEKNREEHIETIICDVLAITMQRYEAAVASYKSPKTPAEYALDVANWLRGHGGLVALATFLICNTTFLVFQQYSFYLAAGYSALVAGATSALMEIGLVVQSISYALLKGFWKLVLVATTGVTIYTAAMVMKSGVEVKASATLAQSAEADAIRKRISVLETLEASSLASIQALDPQQYPSKIEALKKTLNAPGGYSNQIAELRKELQGALAVGAGVISLQTNALVYQQWLFLMLNIVFGHLLGRISRKTSI